MTHDQEEFLAQQLRRLRSVPFDAEVVLVRITVERGPASRLLTPAEDCDGTIVLTAEGFDAARLSPGRLAMETLRALQIHTLFAGLCR